MKYNKMNIYLVLTNILLLKGVCSLNILAIYPYEGKSHDMVHRVLFRELANRGHNITVISHFPEEPPPKNYHHISVAGADAIESALPIWEMSYSRILFTGYTLAYLGIDDCKVLLANKQVHHLINSKQKFDVILLEQFNSDCSLGVAHKIGGPVVGTSTSVLMPYHFYRFGIPNNPSYVSFHFFGGTFPTLIQRIERIIFEMYFKTTFWITQIWDRYTLSQYFDDIPPLEELGREIKFLLMYHHFVLTGSKLLPANVKEVGGFHVPEVKPLKGDLKKFVEEAEHGVIYVSFGTLINTTTVPEEIVKAIRSTMMELPQRFIIKWDKNVLAPEKDKIYVDTWFPQIDILGHPNTLAFLTHSGMGSTVEAIHLGVPMIAMPLWGDQPSNAAAIEESGLGIQIQYKDLTKDNLVAGFKKILEPGFQAKTKELSSAWHDRPRTPMDEAVFWVEFAARHPSLTFRTRAADVPFYQYLFLDIIAIFLAVLFVVTKLLKLWKSYRTQKVTKQKNSQKKRPKHD